MGKSTKTGRLREKTLAEIKQSKQTTFDTVPAVQEKPSSKVEAYSNKQITIIGVSTQAREDDLELKVGFKLVPSRASFSKIIAELYFDGQKLYCKTVRIPQGSLSADELELPDALDMRGISAGKHLIQVEMYELWNSEEKLNCASKEVTIDYVPVRRQDRFIKIPIVKNPSGEIDVVLESERNVWREIEEDHRKELVGKRDEW